LHLLTDPFVFGRLPALDREMLLMQDIALIGMIVADHEQDRDLVQTAVTPIKKSPSSQTAKASRPLPWSNLMYS
jgi:hypothetical protein